MTAPLSDVMEDYLKAIYHLERDADGGRVATSAIADHIDVEPSTVTSALDTLAEKGFVDREKYAGVRLTEEGETVALEVLRHHRLLEAFLAEHLGYDWSEVHDEADRLEHHISEEFERRVAASLDDPDVDPHGDPIPPEELERPSSDAGTPLSACEEGDEVVVSRVDDRGPDELRYLSDAGIAPGTRLAVVEVAPIGMVTVEQESGEQQSLPERVAAAIGVRDAGADADRAAAETDGTWD